MNANHIDLHEPGLILRVYEAGYGARATDHPVKRIQNAYLVSCPAEGHVDEHPSCYIFADTNHWHCYTHPISPKGGNILEMIAQGRWAEREPQVKAAGRAFAWMERELGVARDLRPQNEPRARDAGKRLRDSVLVATYPYYFIDGTLAYQILRIEGYNDAGVWDKDFRFRKPDGAGRWIYHVDGHCESASCACNAMRPGPRAFEPLRIVPLRFRAIANAIARGRTVILNEGEKDAVTLARWNLAATSYPFGAGYPLPDDAPQHFAGAKRVLIPADNDDDGVACALSRARTLRAAGIPADAIHPFKTERKHFDVTDFVQRVQGSKDTYHLICDMFQNAPVIS